MGPRKPGWRLFPLALRTILLLITLVVLVLPLGTSSCCASTRAR